MPELAHTAFDTGKYAQKNAKSEESSCISVESVL